MPSNEEVTIHNNMHRPCSLQHVFNSLSEAGVSQIEWKCSKVTVLRTKCTIIKVAEIKKYIFKPF